MGGAPDDQGHGGWPLGQKREQYLSWDLALPEPVTARLARSHLLFLQVNPPGFALRRLLAKGYYARDRDHWAVQDDPRRQWPDRWPGLEVEAFQAALGSYVKPPRRMRGARPLSRVTSRRSSTRGSRVPECRAPRSSPPSPRTASERSAADARRGESRSSKPSSASTWTTASVVAHRHPSTELTCRRARNHDVRRSPAAAPFRRISAIAGHRCAPCSGRAFGGPRPAEPFLPVERPHFYFSGFPG